MGKVYQEGRRRGLGVGLKPCQLMAVSVFLGQRHSPISVQTAMGKKASQVSDEDCVPNISIMYGMHYWDLHQTYSC